MTDCDEMRASIGAYVLGALDVDEAAAVRRHIQECLECAAERDALGELPALLSLAGGADAAVAEPLSPAFEERLLDAYAREHTSVTPRRRLGRLGRWLRPRWLAVGATTAVAAAAVAVGIVFIGGEPERTYGVAFHNVGATAASARANLDSSDAGTTVDLWVKGLPRDDHAVYEVLCDAQMWTASAGTFRPSADGRAHVVLTTALRKGEYDSIRIVRNGRGADGKYVKRDILTARLS
jgi:anti-sigma-K factor RskA